MADPQQHRPRHRLRQQHTGLTLHSDNEAEVEPGLPSPPYRQYPSNGYDLQSPPYKSRSQVNLMPDNDKGKARDDSEHDIVDDKPQTQKSVHYPENLAKAPFASKRVDSSDGLNNAPSIAPSYDDYDDEDYDWSTEDDLVDEEVKKYQKQVGIVKHRSLFVKYVLAQRSYPSIVNRLLREKNCILFPINACWLGLNGQPLRGRGSARTLLLLRKQRRQKAKQAIHNTECPSMDVLGRS